MPTLTIEVPEDVAAHFAALPKEEANAFAVAVLTEAVWGLAEDAGGDGSTPAAPLRPYREYAGREEYVAAARAGAADSGVDPDVAAGIAEGIADGEEGREITLDELRSDFDALIREQREATRRKSRGRAA